MTGRTEDILGFPTYAGDLPALIAEISGSIDSGGEGKWLACMNPGSYAIAERRPDFAEALRACDWLVPDGQGMVLASRLCGGRIRQRITGWDVFHGLCRRQDERGGTRVFFLGAAEDTLAAVARRFARDYPRLVLAGTYSPPYRDEFSPAEVDAMVEAVRAARADIVWVGMTSPKQDLWIRANRARMGVPFAAGIGAVFDFYAGRIQRAGPLAQRLGMEWVVRVLREPRRMGRRSATAIPLFLGHLLAHRFLGFRRSASP